MARKPKEEKELELRSAALAIRLKPSVKEALAEFAYQKRTSSSELAETAIEEFLKRKGALK